MPYEQLVKSACFRPTGLENAARPEVPRGKTENKHRKNKTPILRMNGRRDESEEVGG